jgi:AraC-like DNA-binding protein
MEFLTSCFLELREEHGFGDDLIKNSVVIKMLTFLNKFFRESNEGYIFVPNNETLAVAEAIKYINQNISEELGLGAIASNSLISVNQLCRLFKKHLGTTVMKYIITKRLTSAKKLLKGGNSVSETAFACGFSDYANFIRTFKNVVGISPGKYAKSDMYSLTDNFDG